MLQFTETKEGPGLAKSVAEFQGALNDGAVDTLAGITLSIQPIYNAPTRHPVRAGLRDVINVEPRAAVIWPRGGSAAALPFAISRKSLGLPRPDHPQVRDVLIEWPAGHVRWRIRAG